MLRNQDLLTPYPQEQSFKIVMQHLPIHVQHVLLARQISTLLGMKIVLQSLDRVNSSVNRNEISFTKTSSQMWQIAKETRNKNKTSTYEQCNSRRHILLNKTSDVKVTGKPFAFGPAEKASKWNVCASEEVDIRQRTPNYLVHNIEKSIQIRDFSTK